MTTERDPARLDTTLVRRAFERAAATCDTVAVLQNEVGARMAERLGVVKLAPAAILDAGCGTGVALGELHARSPDAQLIGLDLAYNMVLAARQRATAVAAGERSLLGRLLGSRRATPDLRPRLLCGDLCRLPLKASCVE